LHIENAFNDHLKQSAQNIPTSTIIQWYSSDITTLST